MSYQRPSIGRFYVWMGADGLHLMPDDASDVVFKHDVAGLDNAKAMMRGLFDLLNAEGVAVKIKRGSLLFHEEQP